METLVSTDWLAEHLDDDDLRVLDCTVILEAAEGGGFRAVSGRSRWAEGHIPGSGFADLIVDLSDPVVAAALHAAHGRALRGGDGPARRRRGHPGRALRPPPQHVGGPPVVDAAGVRLRRRRRARRRLAGLDGGGPAGVDRAGYRSPGGVPRQAPARACSSTATRSSPRSTTAPPACSTPCPPRSTGARSPPTPDRATSRAPATCRQPTSSIRTRTATCRPRRSGRTSPRSSTTRRSAASSPTAGAASPRRPTPSRWRLGRRRRRVRRLPAGVVRGPRSPSSSGSSVHGRTSTSGGDRR